MALIYVQYTYSFQTAFKNSAFLTAYRSFNNEVDRLFTTLLTSFRQFIYTANIYHPAIVKLQPKADKVKEKQ